MDNLEREYKKIEDEIQWPIPSSRQFSDQFFQILGQTKSTVRKCSLKDNLSSFEYNNRLCLILEFLENLYQSLNYSQPDKSNMHDNKIIWHHRNDNQLQITLIRDDSQTICREMLLDATAKYLENPWLQGDAVDWILLDSLIYAELSAFRESIISGKVVGKVNWPYLLSNGDPQKLLWLNILKSTLPIVLRYVFPITALVLLHQFNLTKLFNGALITYGVYIIAHFALWPFRFKYKRSVKKTLEECNALLLKMIKAYKYCAPPIISLSTLHNQLDEAVKDGAIFEGALFTVLKKIEKDKGEVLIPFP